MIASELFCLNFKQIQDEKWVKIAQNVLHVGTTRSHQVPSFAHKRNGEQKGTVGMTYLKNSSIDAHLKVMRG